MSVDLTIGQGSTLPVYTDVVVDQTGSPLDLTGATAKFVLRRLQSAAATVNADMTVTNATAGAVEYAWSASDTATPGLYMAQIVVTFSDGSIYTYPNIGYRSVEIVGALATAPQQLITVEDAKDVLNIPADYDIYDTKILRWVEACRPVIEHITGPIVQQTFEEWHDGGHYRIVLRRRPSSALGTSPVLVVNAVSEYNGPIEWPLAIVSTLDEAVLYSVMVEKERGWVTRTTAGGCVQAFPDMPQAVHVWYTAGQDTVPGNVAQATRELLRVNYQETQERFTPGAGVGVHDEEGDRIMPSPPEAFAIPERVYQLLEQNRRAPACG